MCTSSSRSTWRNSSRRNSSFAERLAPYVADTSLLVDRRSETGERVLFEGAQGTLLDLDHGTYPFVTSSSPIAAGAAVSFGIGPNRIDKVLGVAKAYVTRVGKGPFPSEIVGPDHERVQGDRHRVRTVTGRERRCGWLDLVALRFAVRVNGITSLALTKLDVLSEFDELPVCVRYRLPDEPFAAVALTLFICALALTYIHRTYKMSRPAREAVALSRLARVQRSERRESPSRRPVAVPRLPLESVAAKGEDDEVGEDEVQRR